MNKVNKIFIAGTIVVVLALLGLLAYAMFFAKDGKSLDCKSDTGYVNIYYNDTTIVGYESKGYTFDLMAEKDKADQMGIEKYLEDYSNIFTASTNGKCK